MQAACGSGVVARRVPPTEIRHSKTMPRVITDEDGGVAVVRGIRVAIAEPSPHLNMDGAKTSRCSEQDLLNVFGVAEKWGDVLGPLAIKIDPHVVGRSWGENCSYRSPGSVIGADAHIRRRSSRVSSPSV